MPITRSAIKKIRQDKKREINNLKVKIDVKKGIKKFKRKPSEKLLSEVFSLLDQAAKKGIFHKNKSKRIKSRLSHLLSKPTVSVSLKKTAKKPSTKKKTVV